VKGSGSVATTEYRLGIDGGGTGCRARLTDTEGRTLGEGAAGPANLTLGIDPALRSIMDATHKALSAAGVGEEALSRTDAGLGLAAANVPQHRQAFERVVLPFRSACLRSDAETACLGAHGGRDGAILILGTGSQGVLHQRGRFHTVGGWGFALSDSGSGAILGRAAIRRAFAAHEGIEPASPFTTAVMERFGNDLSAMLDWASEAKPRDWAEYARLTFDHAVQGDEIAGQLALANASAVERMLDRLIALGAPRIALMGGIARPTIRYLSPRYLPTLVEPCGDAMDGALLLVSGRACA
jgi:glucosamine kinase